MPDEMKDERGDLVPGDRDNTMGQGEGIWILFLITKIWFED